MRRLLSCYSCAGKLPVIFYTYLWLRENGTPYYVGKGCRVRAFRKGCPPKERVLLEPHTSETDAFDAEKFLIAYYGRIDKNTGILRNRTDGGEGLAGLKHALSSIEKNRQAHIGINNVRYGKKHTANTLAKMRAAQSGKNNPAYGKTKSAAQKEAARKLGLKSKGILRPDIAGELNSFFGKKHTKEALLLCGNGMRGKHHSVETRNKMKSAHAARLATHVVILHTCACGKPARAHRRLCDRCDYLKRRNSNEITTKKAHQP